MAHWVGPGEYLDDDDYPTWKETALGLVVIFVNVLPWVVMTLLFAWALGGLS